MVQLSPSSQSPLVEQQPLPPLGAKLHLPPLQVSVVQVLPSLQSLLLLQQPEIALFLQLPPAQVSLVQALPSSHSASALHDLTGCQAQRKATQLPTAKPEGSLQSPSAVQHPVGKPLGSLNMVYWHLPERHLSVEQLLPSSHALVDVQPQAASGFLGYAHTPAAQTSAVQSSLSAQSASAAQVLPVTASCLQLPAMHESSVAALLSSHCAGLVQQPSLGAIVHSYLLLHAGSVQASLVVQSSALRQQPSAGWYVYWHLPPLQLSLVQAEPSSQLASEVQPLGALLSAVSPPEASPADRHLPPTHGAPPQSRIDVHSAVTLWQ